MEKFYEALPALDYTRREEPALAVLDVMLPDMDGFTLCQRIRENHLYPIIMLTARVEDMDKITGLTLGADDYITKPFNPLPYSLSLFNGIPHPPNCFDEPWLSGGLPQLFPQAGDVGHDWGWRWGRRWWRCWSGSTWAPPAGGRNSRAFPNS